MFDVLPLVTYSFVMSITPGPNNVMLTASGARFGFRRTLPHLLGVSFGHASQVIAVSSGLGTVFERWPSVQTALQIAGALYLFVLGWQLLRAGGAAEARSAEPLTFWQGALFQYVNPKAWIMSLTIASLFLPPSVSLAVGVAYIVVMQVLVNLPCVTVWALFGSALRNHLRIPARRLAFNATMAIALAITGIAMVL